MVHVVNVVVIVVLIFIATRVIFDINFVVSSVVIDNFVLADFLRVVNCTISPCILMVATAACRRSGEAATPTEQR